jgi:hypothetical protein
MSQQAVFADIIPNSAAGEFFAKNRRNKDTSSLDILISGLPHKFRSLKILGLLKKFKVQE